ncbi:MAG: hypothetical protein H6667_11455 [Ardenticatenaceae bacterium]|nr:hypothetical protein [Ardenticatenaceae bacterium]
MSDDNGLEPIGVLLSREELIFVLDLLQASSLPGLDADPLGDLTPQQRAMSMVWAGRALRARGLGQLNEDGEMALHHALLTAVGVCAYSNDAIFIYHWPEAGADPSRYFGHLRGEDMASHTRPADVLHQFSLLPSRDHLLEQVFDFCGYEDGSQSADLTMTVNNADFVRARELAGDGQTQAAVEALTQNDVPAETAVAFAATLADSPRVSIFQTLKQDGADSVQKSDFTLVQNSDHTWFIAPARDDEAALLVKTTNKNEVETILNELL